MILWKQNASTMCKNWCKQWNSHKHYEDLSWWQKLFISKFSYHKSDKSSIFSCRFILFFLIIIVAVDRRLHWLWPWGTWNCQCVHFCLQWKWIQQRGKQNRIILLHIHYSWNILLCVICRQSVLFGKQSQRSSIRDIGKCQTHLHQCPSDGTWGPVWNRHQGCC